MRKTTSGFTIVELLIVIVVIGILAAITLVAFGNVQQRARDTDRKTDLESLAKALHLYNTDNGNWVTIGGGNGDGTGWVNSDTNPIPTTLQTAGYINKNIQDPRCRTSELSGCSGYIKATCGTGNTQRTFLYARLESVGTVATPADLNVCDATQKGWWASYGMNYLVTAS